MIYSIQQIRAIAAILVVMTHVADVMRDVPEQLFLPNFKEVNIVFTFAAGFLFQHLSINEPFGKFFQRRCRNAVLPYVIISIPAILLYTVGGKAHPSVDLGVVPEWFLPIYLLLTGLHLGPLWFMPMIFMIYLATPVIRHVDRSIWTYAVVIPVSLVLAVLVFTRPEHNENPIQAALHYSPVFIIGMFCSRYNPIISRWSQSPAVWVPALALFLGLAYFTRDYANDLQYPVKIVMLVSIFIVTCRTASVRSSMIDILASYSFGIFFLHGYFVGALRMLQGRGLFDVPQTGFNLLLGTAAVCFACVLAVRTIKLLFGKRSRLLVGA